MAFKIYYPDNVEFAGESGDRPPARGVQVILQHDPTRGPYFQSGATFYVWADTHWQGMDKWGLYDHLELKGLLKPEFAPYYVVWEAGKWKRLKTDIEFYVWLQQTGIVLFGRTLMNEEYQEIYQRAKGDKNQFLPGERKP